ncbi:MAG: hypothetical protein WDN00_02640 [Limisphaerales bacterium]
MRELIRGKIVRSGFVPGGAFTQPIIEVNGKLQFSLPGQPLFPDLGNDTILKPAFNWLLQSDKPGKFNAEVAISPAALTGARAIISSRRRKATSWIWSAGSQ